MKGKKFYFILFALVLIGIGSVFLYRRQQEARFLEFEGYEISAIEGRVNDLYNEEKTDLADNISEDELMELDEILSDLKGKDLGRQNTSRIETMKNDFNSVREMIVLEEDIEDLFVEEDIVNKNTSVSEIEELTEKITPYKDITLYYERNTNALDSAEKQVEAIEEAKDFVETLFTDENVVRDDVTREDEEEALELIEKIKNEEVKNGLVNRIEEVKLALTEKEEALALEEELEAEEEAENEEIAEVEEEPEEQTSNATESSSQSNQASQSNSTPPATSNNTGSPSESTSSSSTNDNRESESNSNNTEDSSETESSGDSNPIVRYRTETVEETIPANGRVVTERPDWELGREVVITGAQPGLRRVTSRTPVYQDGTEGRAEVSTETVREATPAVVQIGTKEPESETEE